MNNTNQSKHKTNIKVTPNFKEKLNKVIESRLVTIEKSENNYILNELESETNGTNGTDGTDVIMKIDEKSNTLTNCRVDSDSNDSPELSKKLSKTPEIATNIEKSNENQDMTIKSSSKTALHTSFPDTNDNQNGGISMISSTRNHCRSRRKARVC